MHPITLTDDLLIGQGRDRACYRHPENPALCIKIALHKEKQTRRERLYTSYMMRKGSDLSLVALYLFTVETNLGSGAVYPLITDSRGNVAPTLTEVIRQRRVSNDVLRRQLTLLKQFLRRNRICVRDLSPNNIVCVFHNQRLLRLMVVDGVINPGISPLNIRIPYLIRKSQRKSWASLQAKIARVTQETEQAWRLKQAA